jgi:predicted dehydrogenase
MTVWPTCRSLFIEKPLANSVIAGRLLLQAAADRGVRVTVGYMLRCLPKLQALRQTLLEGPSAYHVRASFGYDVDQWRASPATYLSPILLEASHEIDLVTWLLGEAPRAISGWEYSLSGDGLLWTSKGTPVSLHLDGLLPTYARRLEVFSLAGRTIWDELEVSATRAVTVDMAYQTELEAWLRDDPMLCTGQEALVTLAVVEAWTQSGRRGGQIVGVIPP